MNFYLDNFSTLDVHKHVVYDKVEQLGDLKHYYKIEFSLLLWLEMQAETYIKAKN